MGNFARCYIIGLRVATFKPLDLAESLGGAKNSELELERLRRAAGVSQQQCLGNILGIDLAKRVFQLHDSDVRGSAVYPTMPSLADF